MLPGQRKLEKNWKTKFAKTKLDKCGSRMHRM